MSDDYYSKLPGSLQSPTPRRPVDKDAWRECEKCREPTPIVADSRLTPDGHFEQTGTFTYVCAHCSHVHVGTPRWSDDEKRQKRCHECDAELGDSYQCPECSFPRAWMRVTCPRCSHRQAVYVPHWVVHCDMFHLECIACENSFDSLCIC
jgi:DNA-directed RNA polymerase subunit RPC12/RpoP